MAMRNDGPARRRPLVVTEESLSPSSARSTPGGPSRRTILAGAGASASLLACPAWAQRGAGKVYKLVVGSPAAALGDIVARLIGQKFADVTGGSAVIDNRAGASGSLAATVVAKAPGDGLTLMVVPDNVLVINPFIQKLPYDPVKDFRGVALVGKASLVLIASPSLGVKTMAELIALAKAKPDTVVFSSGGSGHVTHMGVELMESRLGLQMRHIPYKGTSPALQAVLSGEVGLMLVGFAGALPHIATGKVIPLAASGPAAKQVFPKLPEMKEFHPDLDISVWFGVFAPASTSNEVVTELNQDFNTALQHPDVVRRLGDFGIVPLPSSPAVLEALVKDDRARFGPLVKALGITSD